MIAQPINDEERLFYRKITELANKADEYCPRFSRFLTEREQQLAKSVAEQLRVPHSFFGGYDGASRRMLCVGSDTCREFPLTAVTYVFRAQDSLSHRDFLGALMSLGIERSLVGDIAVGEGAAVAFLADNAAIQALDIVKVGRVGVTAQTGISAPLPEPKTEEKEAVVASARLDSITAACTGLSREKSSLLIKSGAVVLNGVSVVSVSENVAEGDKLSIRGSGKFVLAKIGSLTKKGKYHIIINKYI